MRGTSTGSPPGQKPPDPAVPACSVVVSTRDRPDVLVRCLESVREQEPPPVELIVVDSAPRHRDAREVAERFGAGYLRLHRRGLSRARNRGCGVARGQVVVFLDDDLILQPGCLGALLREFHDPRTAMAGGRIVLEGGDPEAREAFEAFGGFDPGPDRRVVDAETPGWFELVNFGGLGSGAMLAVRRSALSSSPPFDERLGRGGALDAGEEMRAYLACVDRGYRVVYTPDAVAGHQAPESLRELRARVLGDAAAGSAYLFLLLVEHPAHRRRALRYAWEAVRGARRGWRPRPTQPRNAVVSPWRLRMTRLAGPALYARMRLRAALDRAEPDPHPDVREAGSDA
jgi:GT2 family glycosyltransferase